MSQAAKQQPWKIGIKNEWNFSQFICIKRMECLKRFHLCMTKRRSDIGSFIVVFWLFRWMLNEFSKQNNINAPSKHSKSRRCVVTAFIINSRLAYSLHNYINSGVHTFSPTDWRNDCQFSAGKICLRSEPQRKWKWSEADSVWVNMLVKCKRYQTSDTFEESTYISLCAEIAE